MRVIDKENRNVVAMSGLKDRLNLPAFRELDAYWHGLNKEAGVPKRTEVDPRGLIAALPYAFVAERIAPSHARFRVAGFELSGLLGMEVTGMPISAFMRPEDRAEWGARLEEMFATPGILKMSLEAERGLGKPALSACLALYPLRDAAGAVTRTIGCLMTTQGRAGRTPRRFAMSETAFTPIDMADVISLPTSAEPDSAPKRLRGFADGPADFSARPHPKAPYLRVIEPEND